MTNDVDQQLKRLLLSERAPDLPAGFVDQTVDAMFKGHASTLALSNGQAVQMTTRRNRWLLALALMATLSAAWQWRQERMSADEDLMNVDTLSMSSLLVL